MILRNAVAALISVQLFGFIPMYGLIYQNGYYEAVLQLIKNGPHVLPGSANPILTFYCGIPPLDQLLTLASIMFANVTDGSYPPLSLYAVNFAGQFLGVLILIILEGLRNYNQASIFRFASFWGCLMQATGYGFAMPLYSILFLLRPAVLEFRGPDLVDRIRPRNLAELEVLPIALGLGYVLLAIAMSQPSVPNYLHQWLGALWQASPFWIMVWQKLLAAILARWRNTIQKGGDNIQIRQGLRPGSPMNSNTRHVERMLLGRAYELAFFSCLASHIAPLVFITIASSDIPVFSSLASEALTFSNVFIPPSPIWVEKMASMASGIHSFFQYDQYLGSAAAIIWSWTLWYNYSGNESNTTTATTETLRFGFVFLVASPAGTVVWFIWDRDHRLLIRHESTKKH